MNTTVVITGGGGVLCSAFAKEMARTGAPVALLDRNLQAAEHTAEEIAQEGGTARAYAADVLDRESLEAAHAAVLRDFGKCRVLINGAGGNHPGRSCPRSFPAFLTCSRRALILCSAST